jgi:uncharacterized protein YodC (DUF2158 family)
MPENTLSEDDIVLLKSGGLLMTVQVNLSRQFGIFSMFLAYRN